jgi:hypothetical protein
MVLSIGAANEAAIAFLEADKGGALDEMLKSGWPEMRDIIDRLRQECDEHNPTSLRKKILLVVRNTLGFHWDTKVVEGSLHRLRDANVAVWAGGENEQIADTAFPLVSAIIHDSLKARIGFEAGVDAMMAKIVVMQADCYNLAHGLYTTALKQSGIGGPSTTLSGSLPGGGKDDLDVDSSTSQHVDQGIDAKEVDPAANEVADPGLCDAE